MRHLLVDHARARRAVKRGLGERPLPLEDAAWLPDDRVQAIAELDEALSRLEALDERRTRILEQRYSGALSLEEAAEWLGISLATVKRQPPSARAWLALELQREVPDAADQLGRHRGDGRSRQAFAEAGEIDAAFELLELLFTMPAGRTVSVALLRVWPGFDPLRSDPRFEELLARFATTR